NVAAIADDRFAARKRVADLRGRSAIDVRAVQHGEDGVRAIDRTLIASCRLGVGDAEDVSPSTAVRTPARAFDGRARREFPRIDHLVTRAAQPGEQATVVELAPGRSEAERAGDVDPHEA